MPPQASRSPAFPIQGSTSAGNLKRGPVRPAFDGSSTDGVAPPDLRFTQKDICWRDYLILPNQNLTHAFVRP